MPVDEKERIFDRRFGHHELPQYPEKGERCYDTEAWMVHGPLAVTFR